MNFVLLINAAVSLIMGCALVLVWRRDPTQVFTRFIGWANLVQLLVPVTYWLKVQQGGSLADMVGNFVLALIAAVYSTLLLVGVAQLAMRPLSNRSVWVVLLGLAAINAATVGIGGPRVGQA